MSNITLNFVEQQQEQDRWCWAAVGASVYKFYDAGSIQTQCRIANSVLNRTDCCGAGAHGVCNVDDYLPPALGKKHWADWIQNTIPDADPAQDHDLLREMEAARPVCVRIAWSEGGAHFVVVAGYSDVALGGARMLVEDPVWGATDIPYSGLVGDYLGDGTWTDTFLTKP